MQKVDKKILIKKISIVVLFLVVLIGFSIRYSAEIYNLFSNAEVFRSVILSYGNKGVLVLLGFQILQVLIPFIPGEIVQAAGGYVFGATLASIILLSGTVIGGVLVFYLSRYIGYPLVTIFVNQETMEKFSFLMKSKKTEWTLFILFLLPGIPKDTLIYFAGLTPIKPVRFFAILTLARIPGILITTSIGSNMLDKNYNRIYVLAVVICILLAVAILFRKKILNALQNHHNRRIL